MSDQDRLARIKTRQRSSMRPRGDIDWLIGEVTRLRDLLGRLEWVTAGDSIVGYCPACGKPQTGTTLLEVVDGQTVTRPAPGHAPGCEWVAVMRPGTPNDPPQFPKE
jgi:hypothetical protein